MQEIKYALALQKLLFYSPQTAMMLYREIGSAENVYAHKGNIKDAMADATNDLYRIIDTDWKPLLEWADRELAWCKEKNIKALCPHDEQYPHRLDECCDAPLVLYYRGTADLNAPHIISIVGTRNATPYGQDMVQKFVHSLKELVPDIIIFSGLAYGIDVSSHRSALAEGLETVGVVAHGMDMIYPAAHRNIAVKMLSQGGLITEYPSRSRVDKANFLRRNRIVAGMGDAVIVAESKRRGGSLSTARIAVEYGRPVFAFPGRIGDENSEGCNELIRDQKAQLITSARDVIDMLGWKNPEVIEAVRHGGIQTQFFPNLSEDEQLIVNILRENDLQQNIISVKTRLPISKVSSLLFSLEMQGIVKCYAGGSYHLISY